MKYQCMTCTKIDENGSQIVEFDSRADWLAHAKQHKDGKPLTMPKEVTPPAEPAPVVPVTPPAEVPRKPIALSYKYSGECDRCGREVDTLYVNVDDVLMVVAYCPTDHLQITQQKVIPIDEQFTKSHNKIK